MVTPNFRRVKTAFLNSAAFFSFALNKFRHGQDDAVKAITNARSWNELSDATHFIWRDGWNVAIAYECLPEEL